MTCCPLCIQFVQDFLEYNSSSTNLSAKRLSPLTRTIANELLRILRTIQGHHNMVDRVKREYLILVEKKIHTPAKPLHLHLFDVSLNYYNYIDCNTYRQSELKGTIELICIELLSNGVFKCKQSSDPLGEAKSWILEKYFFVLEHLKEIHDEHSGIIPISTNTLVFQKHERISDEEIDSWDNLYT